MTVRIRGVLAPVVTPFKTDLAPDSQRFIAHCKWLLSQNCGLAVFGTNSEANSLSMEERATLLDELVAAGVDPSRMMPGTGCCSIMETVKLTKQAVGNGCAGVLMLPPFYYKDVSEEGLYRYFSEVVQRVGDARLKIYLYHIPPVAVVGITTGLVERLLAAYPNAIAGMKDSSGDWNNTQTFLDAFAKSGFDVFVGSESFLLANLRNDGVGTISATANVNPAAIHSVFAEATTRQEAGSASGPRRTTGKYKGGKLPSSLKSQGDEPAGLDLESLQARLNVVREVFSSRKFPSMIAALKQAIAIYADDPAWRTVRPPLVELTPEQTKTLAVELKAISFTMPGVRRVSKG
ncbi:MAG: dihydrodipicolinate synthase family protein [Verrucomicrobia bacterium]|nr:MAG: dihydrodipicolinate synthase family protein [Verrucomicrobiota bacterium]